MGYDIKYRTRASGRQVRNSGPYEGPSTLPAWAARAARDLDRSESSMLNQNLKNEVDARILPTDANAPGPRARGEARSTAIVIRRPQDRPRDRLPEKRFPDTVFAGE